MSKEPEAKPAAQPAAQSRDSVAREKTVTDTQAEAQRVQDEKQKEFTRRETEAIAAQSAGGPGFAGPDPTGKAEGAANYDPPDLAVKPGTEEWHLQHPGEITSGQFKPREQSAEDHAKAMGKTNTEAQTKKSA